MLPSGYSAVRPTGKPEGAGEAFFVGYQMSKLHGFWKPDPKEVAEKEARAERRAILKSATKKAKKKPKKRWELSDRTKAKLAKAGVTDMGKPHPDYVKDADFYSGNAWKTLRYAALKNSDGRCNCCGASAGDGVVLHCDHVIPRYKAPHLALEIGNIQILCGDCNIGKGAWDSTDWRDHMRSI